MTPHHIGCAVRTLDDSYATYGNIFGLRRRTRAFNVASQQVRVCFVELSNRFYLELIAPTDNNTKLSRFMKVGFYHLCFLVDDIALASKNLVAKNCGALPTFESEAFDGSRCQFFVTPQSHLIELAEMQVTAFEDFFHRSLASINQSVNLADK